MGPCGDVSRQQPQPQRMTCRGGAVSKRKRDRALHIGARLQFCSHGVMSLIERIGSEKLPGANKLQPAPQPRSSYESLLLCCRPLRPGCLSCTRCARIDRK